MKNIFKNKNDHPTEKLPMPHKVKRGFSFYCSTVLAMTLVMGLAMPASATGGDPLTVFQRSLNKGEECHHKNHLKCCNCTFNI